MLKCEYTCINLITHILFLYETCTLGENIIGVPKMQNNYGAFKFIIFQCCNSNMVIFSNALCKVIFCVIAIKKNNTFKVYHNIFRILVALIIFSF